MSSEVKRRNKDVAGYLILNIIAEIDGHFDPMEGQAISQYIQKHFPLGGNLEDAMETLSATDKADYPLLFQRCAEDFYVDSTPKERLKFIQEALEVMNADDKVDSGETWLINKLYQYWDL